MAEQQLPPALAGDERFVWLNELMNENVQQLDLNAMLVYLVDLVKPSLLPILAEQFSMLEEAAWPLARSDDDRRALIKTAIELHRYKGTPWAVKQALALIGYPVLELIEYQGYQRDWVISGGKVLNGSWSLSSGLNLSAPFANGKKMRVLALNHWAQYSVRLDMTNSDWTRQQQRKIRQVAEAYAPASRQLVSIIATMRLVWLARPVGGIRASAVRSRMTCCSRFQPFDRLTLSGCWALTVDYQRLVLDGTWTISAPHRIDGRKATGRSLAQGQIAMRHRMRLHRTAAIGGARSSVTRLDGTYQINGAWTLGRLDGPLGSWCNAGLRTTKNGVITRELL